MTYRVLKITSFYKSFLEDFYFKNKTLNNEDYDLHYKTLMNTKYAWSDYFKQHSEKAGIEVFEIVHNATLLQTAWKKKHPYQGNSEILIEQVAYYKPDVIFFQDIKSFSGQFIKTLKEKFSFIKLIFGHSCSPFSKLELENFKFYDFLLTCLPTFKTHFEINGIKSYKLDHGFETSILDYLNINNNDKKDYIFIGSLIANKDFHDDRLKYIKKLVSENIDIKLHTSFKQDGLLNLKAKQAAFIMSRFFNLIGLNRINQSFGSLRKVAACKELPKNENISSEVMTKVTNNNVYGMDMYNLLANSLASLNIHGGIAGNYAVNMRLFETTGVGSLLLTDHKDNIKDFFEPDYEIITFKSIDECIEKSRWLIDNPKKAMEIAKAGQKRTLKDHNLENRFLKIHEIIKENLS